VKFNAQVTQAFGGGRSAPDGNTQAAPESLTATTRRRLKGPRMGGHFSVHAIVDSSTATSATGLTLWYSNVPDPDLTTDTDWKQDTTVGTIIALTAAGSAFVNVGNVCAEHYMLKADVTAGACGLRVFCRAEGVEV
jgi:hypothetical protein